MPQGIAPFGEDICVLACAREASHRKAREAEDESAISNAAIHEAEAHRPEVSLINDT